MKKKNSVLCAFAFLVMIILCCFCLYLNESKAVFDIKYIVDCDDQSVTYNVYTSGNELFFFLPSGMNFEQKNVSCSPGYRLEIKEYDSGEYRISVLNPFGFKVSEKRLYVLNAQNIPSLYITLKKGTINDINSDSIDVIHSNNKTKLSGDLVLYSSLGEKALCGEIKNISGRGNSSWSQAKKPYTLKMKNECELIQGTIAKNYVLVANGCDDSNLRNKIVFDAARAVGLSYTPATEWVDLYVDGDYLGLYLLTTKIEVSDYSVSVNDLEIQTQSRNVFSLSSYPTFSIEENGMLLKGYDIPSNPNDVTGGYLLELELEDRINRENNLFTTKNNVAVSVKYPSAISREQIEYLSGIIQNLEDSLNKESVFDYIDIESWVNYYLIQEVFANDSKTSYFFYKDNDRIDSHIFAGPAWDYDLTMGTAYSINRKSPNQFAVNTWGWFEKLYSNDLFYCTAVDRYKEFFVDYLSWLCQDGIDNYCKIIAASYRMNALRWDGIQNFEYCDHFATLDEHADSIKRFLQQRLDFLNYEWCDQGNELEGTIDDKNAEANDSNVPANENTEPKLLHYIKAIYHHPEPYITYAATMIFLFFLGGLLVKEYGLFRKEKNDRRRD